MQIKGLELIKSRDKNRKRRMQLHHVWIDQTMNSTLSFLSVVVVKDFFGISYFHYSFDSVLRAF